MGRHSKSPQHWWCGFALALIATGAPLAAEPVPDAPPKPGRPSPDELLEEVASFGGVRVRRIHFTGREELDEDDVEESLYHQAASRWPWGKKMAFLPREFVRDLRRLGILYERRGFPSAEIRGQVNPRPDGESVDLEFTITEGRPVMVSKVKLLGWPESEDWGNRGEKDPDDVLRQIALSPGGRLDRTRVEQSLKSLVQFLKQNGHFQAAARDSIELAGNEARVLLVVTPGPRFRVRNVALTPEAKAAIGDLPHRMVLDEFDFDRGEIYDPKRLADGRDELIGLDLFRRVAIEPEPVGGDTLDLKIDVARLSSRSTAIGIGYGSEDKLRGQARWLERDFLGGGRRLEIKGQASFIEQELSAAVTQPRIFHTRSDLTVRAFLGNETEDNYDLVRLGGGLGVQRPLARDVSLRVGVDHEENRLTVKVPDEALPDEGPSKLTDLKTFLTYDATNDRLNPKRGTRAFLALDGATDRVWSDYTYGAAAISLARYEELRPNLIFAGVVRGGVALPAGETNDLPVWRRFYGGGSTDMRSYARRTLGPLDSEGNGVGGETMIEFGAEFRQRLRGPLGCALFVEAGQVWEKVAEVDLANLELGAGAGLRLGTPVGPFRVDVGWKLTAFDPQLNPLVGHFSIGEAF